MLFQTGEIMNQIVINISRLGWLRLLFRKLKLHVAYNALLSFEQEWFDKMGTRERCDVLKVDIEGCELEFLKANKLFLAKVDNAFIECHDYRVTLEEMNAFMTSQGFGFVQICTASGHDTTAFYKRVYVS
jgi:hypothetical protein